MSTLPPLSIRQATGDDGAAIAALLADLGYPCTAGQARAQLAALDGSADAVFLALSGDAPAGLVATHLMRMLHTEGHWCRITDLVVAAPHRRRGLATALLRHAEEFARASGATRVELTCSTSREAAHQFYARNGYASRSTRFYKPL